MKFIKVILCICTLCWTVTFATYAQKTQKVQIVLIGTVHLTPSTTDLYKNDAIDLHTPEKQKEIQEVVNKIVAFKPTQICLEYPMEKQRTMDSIFNAYQNGQYKLKDNERDLFGFQAVKKLGLKSPTCINYPGKFDSDTVMNFAMANNQKEIVDGLKKAGTDFMAEINNKLAQLTLRNFLIYINSEEALQNNLSIYTRYLATVGKGNNYVGTGLVADWYSTNIHIYANILRIVKPTDKRIVVIFGQGHIPILKHLFNNNPDFEVVDPKDVLK